MDGARPGSSTWDGFGAAWPHCERTGLDVGVPEKATTKHTKYTNGWAGRIAENSFWHDPTVVSVFGGQAPRAHQWLSRITCISWSFSLDKNRLLVVAGSPTASSRT